MNFTDEQKKARRIKRLAEIIHDHWEEESGMDTRFFDHPFVNDIYVVRGQSAMGGNYREHVVPRAFLRDKCLEMYSNQASIDDVANILIANLIIVKITENEAETLNAKFKDTMPAGWVLGKDDPFERLYWAGIKLQQPL